MRIMLLLFLLLSAAASAQVPQVPPTAGFWWNPNESGRGWNIEIQNDIVAVTHFVYRTDGSATFLQSAGAFDLSTGVVTGVLNAVEQGQCIGCPYQRPTSAPLGTVRFEFSSASQGRVIYPDGTTINIQPFVYGYANSLAAMFGTWMTNWVGPTGAVFPAFVQFTTETQVNPTLRAALGRTVFPTPNRTVLASETQGIYLVLIDASTNFYDLFYVTATVRTFEGFGCTYRKGTQPPTISACNGSGFGSRIYSDGASRRLFGAGPSASPSKLASDGDAPRALEYAASNAGAPLAEPFAKAASDPAVHALLLELDRAMNAQNP